MENNENRVNIFSSTIAEENPIVIQLQEFGYNQKYSRRLLFYLHPEDLEEALNYMAIENGIIQHRFVNDRNISNNNICYICGEERNIHLPELDINININLNNIEDTREYKTGINENNSNEIQNSNISNNINNSINDSKLSDTRNNEQSRNKESNSNFSEQTSNFSFNPEEKKNEMDKIMSFKDKNKIKLKEEKIECIICNELFIVNKKNKVQKCGHAFCCGCWYDALSVKINQNKLPSIKCLEYECKEKLTDEFIINLLKSDQNLIKKYKQYKLELEIITNPNKKLCPFPNCDSYLELKQLRNKEVKCKNNHSFCFICLKKPHGKLPCNNNLDKSIVEYATNNFVKKCPKCSIITEKNKGCNHITCSKCGYQWCWLCNKEYNINHFNEGKCKGFQFFQPQNDYDIKLMMEGKINKDQLSMSQRQFEDNLEEELDVRPRMELALRRRRIEDDINIREIRVFQEENDEDNYNREDCSKKFYYVFMFLLFGNWPYILKEYNKNNCFNLFSCFILSFSLFFQLLFINIITFILLVIFLGFKKFISRNHQLFDIYIKKLIIILVNALLADFCYTFSIWKDYADGVHYCRKLMKFIVFFPCVIMSTIVLFPQRIIINIICIIITFIYQSNFSNLIYQLNKNFSRGFGLTIGSNF